MKKHKILVDRKPLTENYIQSRQDFGKVIKGVKQLKPPLWKSAWFYGPVGMATVALTISANSIHANEVPIIQKKMKNNLVIVEKEKPTEVLKVSEVKKTKIEESKFKIEVKQKEKNTESTPIIEEKEIINVEPKNKIIEEKTTFKKAYPNILNVYTGDITFSELFSEEGITCGTSTITSFSIQYFNGKDDVKEEVKGNRIPEKMSKLIEKYNKGVMIYITDIEALDEKGRITHIPSLNYIPRY